MSAVAGRSNLQQRVLSGIVLIVVALALTWAGGVWFRLLAVAIAAAVLYEWTAMALPEKARAHRLVLGVLLGLVLIMLLAGVSVRLVLLALGAAVVIGTLDGARQGVGLWAVAGLAYAGLCAVSLSALRGADWAGLVAMLFLFAVVWATDILAYFTGRAVGGPKLAPSISPGKTWSGAAGGTVAGVLAGLLVGISCGATLGWAMLVLLAFVLSVLSQIGDLFESSLKRRFGAKDSSQLIPGHGGVMDRVDGLAAAALAMFALGALAAGLGTPSLAFFGG